ncbi:hypothetical protein HN51_036758 [Arachis hypogaea]|uniref:Uncharacterized protein n=1 Tax=Arachis hypogaea TaxID=3818 RepID=A0A444ZYC3_ARAHY|nr:sodium/potassium/calcium exchanger 1 [Arachis ipaensis]XP_025640627.1 sodium/potassium/calcium exchanger 1 [Arachis hypogaea]RYR19230.1 hypothetical protein Ahy_B03g063948 [Arachis hypogaea]
MGGANSKIKLNSGTVRRFEEFKKRRNATKLQAEKELLKDGGNRDNNSQSSNGTKPPAEEVSTKEELPVRELTAEKPSRVVPLPTSTAKHESVEGRDVEKDSKHNHHHNQEKVDDSNESKVEQDNKHKDHYGQEKVEEFQENVKQDEKHNNHDGQEKVKASQESNLKKDDKHNDHDDGKEKVSHVIEKALEDIEIQKGQTEETKEDDEVFVDAKGSIDVNEQREEFGIFLPGSPSFRIYCIEANKAKVEQEELLSLEEEEDHDEDDEEEEEEEEEEGGEKHSIAAMHQKAHSTDSVIRPPSESGSDKSASLTSDSLNSETPIAKPGKEPRTKRKGKKAKKFGAGNVKRLFKVKSCYYPTCSCAGIDDRRRMVAPPRPHN